VKGNLGVKGYPGDTGPQGQKGGAGYGIESTVLFARHFQDASSPRECPRGTIKIYEGYSFIMGNGNGEHIAMDLGTPSSCLQRFSLMPFFHCQRDGSCHIATRSDRSYWLATTAPLVGVPMDVSFVQERIARCVVCETQTELYAFHAQKNEQNGRIAAECPDNWVEVWNGYSFIMHTFGGRGGGQQLSSPGSCLEYFRYAPLIECNNGMSLCHYWSDAKAYYLRNIDPDQQFRKPPSKFLNENTENSSEKVRREVSRCRVCMKRSLAMFAAAYT
jgi:collagen type IV alpha